MKTQICAPMVGKVSTINVKVGDRVKKNDVVATLEAMKMFINVYTPADGTVVEIIAAPNEVIGPNKVLMVVE